MLKNEEKQNVRENFLFINTFRYNPPAFTGSAMTPCKNPSIILAHNALSSSVRFNIFSLFTGELFLSCTGSENKQDAPTNGKVNETSGEIISGCCSFHKNDDIQHLTSLMNNTMIYHQLMRYNISCDLTIN